MQVIKIQPRRTIGDWIKWFVAFFLMVAIVAGNFYFVQVVPALKTIGDLLAFLILLGILSFTREGQRFWKFAKEAKNELRRVVWPKKNEAIQTTLVIIGVVIIVALFLWAVDSLLFWGMSFITGQRG